MARPLRVEFDGAVYHVTFRGNAREDIFDDDAIAKGFWRSQARLLTATFTEPMETDFAAIAAAELSHGKR